MTRKEKLRLLKEWRARLLLNGKAVDAVYDLLKLECPPIEALYATEQSYTRMVAAAVGDKHDCLNWYYTECELGRKPMRALLIDGTEILVKTPAQLLRVFEDDQ